MIDAKSELAELSFRRAAADEIVDLRHRILRSGLPRESAIFPGDERDDSIHYGAFLRGRAIACATVHLNMWDGSPAWQLRGMAADDGYRGLGIGGRVLELLMAETIKASPSIPQFWCNARVPAARFYQRLGWKIVSEVFDIPTAGPHVKMTRRFLSAALNSTVSEDHGR